MRSGSGGCLSVFLSALFVCLRGELPLIPNLDDELRYNSTTLRELLKLQSNPFLQDLQGHWSFNDTIDISKYEEFDHTKFQGGRELSLDELLEKAREIQRAARRRLDVKPTSTAEEMPVFDTTLVTNVTAQLGSTAFLHCRVKNLNNRAVSWVRKRDWHILTSAMLTYTNDERFQVIHAEGSDDWTLQIKYVQKRDNGPYECQVATGQGTLTHLFNLIVMVPTAYILGTGEYHIGHGSTISLVCIIENSPIPPQYVMWYHNDELINSAASGALTDSAGGGGVARGGETSGGETSRVVTEPGGEKTHSRLLITEATSRHSGNYTCRASNTTPDSVYVFVSTDGDNIAAIQRHDASGSVRPCVFLFLTTLLRLLLRQWCVLKLISVYESPNCKKAYSTLVCFPGNAKN